MAKPRIVKLTGRNELAIGERGAETVIRTVGNAPLHIVAPPGIRLLVRSRVVHSPHPPEADPMK